MKTNYCHYKSFKIISIIILLSISINNINSQEKYKTYYNNFSDKTFDIDILYDDSLNYILFIDMLSLENDNNNSGGIYINTFEHQSFIDTLKKVMVKYEEWVNVGKTNNVDIFIKKLKIKYQTCGYFQYKTGWEIDDIIVINFIFKIVDGKKYLLTMATNNMTSTEDSNINHDGFVLIFSSPEEIDYFINILSIKSLKKYLKSPKTTDLFKN